MTHKKRVRIHWAMFIVAIALGILLPATKTTILVVGCLAAVAYLLSPVFARIFKVNESTDA